MPIHCARRMKKFLEKLDTIAVDLDTDIVRECEDEWSKAYAIALVTVIPEGNDHYFDYEAYLKEFRALALACFGPTAEWVYGDRTKKDVELRLHRVSGGYEIEAFRSKRKRTGTPKKARKT